MGETRLSHSGFVDFCRALIRQPALSTTDELALTYFSVEDEHIRMVTAHWGRE